MAVDLVSFLLRGREQLQFSNNEGRQRIYTSCSYSLEPVCATDQANVTSARYRSATVFRADPTHAQLSKLNHMRKYTRLSSSKAYERLGTRLVMQEAAIVKSHRNVRSASAFIICIGQS